MQADPEFYGPLQYGPVWMWAGVALLVLVAAWYAFVLAATRRPREAHSIQRPAQLTNLAALKAAYLQRIDDVERDAAAGTRSARGSHQEISLLLRKFVRDATGVDAPRMTQADLARHPLPAAAAAVGALYPAAFGPDPVPSVASSAAAARRAVQAWN
ncbi:hypothetical protein [Pseudarthrobacter polychromogenes]|uniref:DUF4381 domain-containing protein n=1 Tax=Pseudarthrobacter polychromogenes TaxID=1676 RepID=A0ABQ1XB54_9MICC|nr:hypothetical protein [Pseudarthrobacter polychromogenes]GGG84405.1 hypothetical protein GCM10011577_02500 [Pseudarthrobacter polychromogenes]